MNEMTSKVLEEENVRESENSTEQIERLILVTTVHETGHYIVNRALINYRSSILLTTLPDEEYSYLGQLVCNEMANVKKRNKDYLNETAMLLAGTVAVKLFLTDEFIESINIVDLKNGNNDDLEKALKLANKIAPEYCCKSREICKACNKLPKRFKRQFLESARNRVLKEAEELARRTILEHKEQFVEVGTALIRRRELTEDELEELYNLK